MNELNFKIVEEDVELFVASLALGILEGIKSKDLLHEVGVWSLARPAFLSPLMKEKRISAELTEVLKQFDELELLNELDSENCESTIDSMMLKLKAIMLDVNEDACRISCA